MSQSPIEPGLRRLTHRPSVLIRDDAGMANPYPRRNALIGLVPLVALLIGAALGGGGALLVGVPEIVGSLVGAVAGFLASRWILRRSFERHLS